MRILVLYLIALPFSFVAKAAYPDLFKDLDPQQTYLNFYKNYLPVTPEGTIYLFPETK